MSSRLLTFWFLLGSAQTQSVIDIGETAALSSGDGGNGNLLLAQRATLAQAATVESLSFYVITTAGGSPILGIYDATGPSGGPGVISTNSVIGSHRRRCHDE